MATSERNIVITGFMGTGKSTVGPLVAQSLNRLFIETDREIELAAGMSVPRLFAEKGEAAFRALEHELCAHLVKQTGLVIATGGGMLVDDTNRRLMLDTALVICLTASFDELALRLADSDGRPLAGNWQNLLLRRQSAYAEIPHQIDTTGKSPELVAEEVIALWNESA